MTFTALLAISSFSGCALLKIGGRKKRAEPEAPRATLPRLLGKITLVNEEEKFALIDIGSLPAPEAGLKLRSMSATSETGELTVSAARRRPFVIADIESGEPQIGNRVFEK